MSKVRELIARGYEQVSRKHCLVASLPDGVTGLEALRAADPSLVKRWEENLERQAAEYFRRVHACPVKLSPEDFDEFRRIKAAV